MLVTKRFFAVSVLTTLLTSNINAAGFSNSNNSASGIGSAFAGASAIAEDASTTFFNPAGLSKLEGSQFVIAGHYVSPSASFTNNGSARNPALGAGALSGGNDDPTDPAFIPSLYYANKLNDKWTFGLGITVPFGNATEYSDTWVGRYHATKTEIITLNINPSVSFKVNNKLSVGFGVNVQHADATLANQIDSAAVCLKLTNNNVATCSSAPINLATLGNAATDSSVSLSGDDWSLGWNIGLLYDISGATRFGVAYRSNVKHSVSGTADFTRTDGLDTLLGASTAFADSGMTTEVTLPETLSLSVQQMLSPKWTMLGDVTWTKWSRFDKIVVNYDSAHPTSTLQQNWEDSLRYSLGVNYQADAKWIYRAGLAFDESAISSAEKRSARTPDTNRTWLSLGFGYKMSATSSIDVGYTHIFFDDAPINNSDATNTFGHTLTGSYDISADIFSAQFNWKF